MLQTTQCHAAVLRATVVGIVLWGALETADAQETHSRRDGPVGSVEKSSSGIQLCTFPDLCFEDVTGVVGFAQSALETESVAWGDYNNDGWPDVYFTNDGANALYRNNGDGTFTDVTAATKTGHAGHGKGVVFGDLDNDGDLDLIVVNDYAETNVLYRNDGPSKSGMYSFTDITAGSGLDISENSHGVSLLDYNRDGLLDIFICGVEGPILCENIGEMVFEQVWLPVTTSNWIPHGAGIVVADFDNNRWPDMYFSDRSGGPSHLLLNSEGVFSNSTSQAGVGVTGPGSGVVAFDYDRDGDIDLFRGAWPTEDRLLYTDVLFRNSGSATFEHVTLSASISNSNGVTMGPAVGDVNNDGWIDFFLTNANDGSATDSQLLVNNGDGTFVNMLVDAGLTGGDHRGAAFADYDRDGDLDLCITGGAGTPTRLYRNDFDHGLGNWLGVELQGSDSNRDGVGALIQVLANGATTTQEAAAGAGLGSQNDGQLLFGLGASTIVDTVEVFWPSGRYKALNDVAVNQVLRIREPISTTDINRDGVVNVGDLLLLLAAWGECDFCAADQDENGFVDVQDMLVLLADYHLATEAPPLPVSEEGWVDFEQGTDTRIIYASSSEGQDR